MISNMWGKLDLYCGHVHEKEALMQLQTKRGNIIYQCPYCKNYFSGKDIEKMLDKIEKIIMEAEEDGEMINIKNLSFSVGKCKYKILDNETRLKVKGENLNIYVK